MKHVRLTLVLLALALTMKALVPAGIMPSTGGDRFLTVTICADASGSPRQMQIAIADREDGPGDQPEVADSAAPCAFSGLGHAALGGADPVLLAAVLAFILALGFAPPHALRLRQHALLRPPPRGPPLRAV
jgi:hypothetical protein